MIVNSSASANAMGASVVLRLEVHAKNICAESSWRSQKATVAQLIANKNPVTSVAVMSGTRIVWGAEGQQVRLTPKPKIKPA